MATGAIRWVSQVLPNDVWAMGCAATNAPDTGCPPKLGDDYDFSASPVLAHLKDHDVLVLPQKSSMAYAMDPDRQGKILWQYRLGKGSGLGGMWGGAVEGDKVLSAPPTCSPRPPGASTP